MEVVPTCLTTQPANPKSTYPFPVCRSLIIITGHPDAATMADDDSILCGLAPTGKTRQIGTATLRVYAFVAKSPD